MLVLQLFTLITLGLDTTPDFKSLLLMLKSESLTTQKVYMPTWLILYLAIPTYFGIHSFYLFAKYLAYLRGSLYRQFFSLFREIYQCTHRSICII